MSALSIPISASGSCRSRSACMHAIPRMHERLENPAMPQIIKNRTVIDDDWLVVRAAEDGGLPPPDALPTGKIIVPFSYWQASREALTGARAKSQIAVWLAPDSEPEAIVGDFDAVALIAIDFPVFRDGRGYSIARLLRERYGYTGEIRAIGDVLHDQLL